MKEYFIVMSIKKRLDLVVKELGLTGRAFEKEVGLANGSYSSIGDGVGAEKLNKIFDRYPHLSADWLLRGLGEMTKSDNNRAKNVSGVIFAENSGINSENSQNQEEEMKTVLYQMAALVSAQQKDISRLIDEIEQNGRRTDRIMTIIEQHGYIKEEPGLARSDSASYSRSAGRFE